MPLSLNRSDIINLVLARCGRQEGNAYLAAQAVTELKLIQSRLEGEAFMPWFLLSDESSLVSAAATKTTALPTDFLREYEDFPLYLYDSTAEDPYTQLTKDEYDVLESKFGEDSPTVPSAYALQGSALNWFPTPDAIYNFRWKYYQAQPSLDETTSSNAWTENAADLLVAELGIVIAGSYKKDADRAQMFGIDLTRAQRRLLSFDEARKQANRDLQMGDAQ